MEVEQKARGPEQKSIALSKTEPALSKKGDL